MVDHERLLAPEMVGTISLPQGLYLGEPVVELYNPGARENLIANGASVNASQLYDKDGNWILRGEKNIPHIYDLPPEELLDILALRVRPVYDSVDLALMRDKASGYGFNVHNWDSHVLPVTVVTVELLKMFGYDKPGDPTVSLGIAAGALHDTGNQIKRKGHSLQSPYIGAALFPDLLSDEANWKVIKDSVELHDEPVLLEAINEQGLRSTDEIIEFLESLGPVANALVLADKVDINRRRSNKIARTEEAIRNDMHAWVNVASSNGRFAYDERYGYYIGIDFNPTISKEEEKEYPDITREGKHRLRVPDAVHQLHREHNIPHSDIWKANLFDIYHTRLELAIFSAFALSKKIDQINIVFFDREAGKDYNFGFSGQPFRRQFLRDDILASRQKNMRKEQRLGSNRLLLPPQN